MRQLSLLVVLLVATVFSVMAADFNQKFTVDVIGSFRHEAFGNGSIPVCEYCDCPDGGSCNVAWPDNQECPEFNITADDNQQRWGDCAPDPLAIPPRVCRCFLASGIGFRGVTDVEITANDDAATNIGRVVHYNNPVAGTTPTALRLTLTITAPELTRPFYISYPLGFSETPNLVGAGLDACDPSIQQTSTPCDDRFSFNAVKLTDSFLSDGVRYTLDITGFLQDGSEDPIRQFTTEENAVSIASVFARIITFCEEDLCNENEEFIPFPVCNCICKLDDEQCKQIFNEYWSFDETTCNCVCNRSATTCPESNPFNPETCSCCRNTTDALCRLQNPLFGASWRFCGCECHRQLYINCARQKPFYVPVGADCECECGVTNDKCKERFGKKYRARQKTCDCAIPGEDTGLTSGAIAGIVVASVLGPLFLIGLILLLGALLVYLIKAGYIPGIYGHKIEQGNFTAGGNSGLYADPWLNNTNAAAV